MAEAQCVLGVFAKQPLPGAVKTRVAAETSPDFAARLSEALLRDTLFRFRRVEAHRVLAFTPPEAGDFFDELAQGIFVISPQSTGDLGARMAHFFREQLTQSGRVVLIGTDSPSLPLEYVEGAFEELRSADVVLGPASDGGFYLIGCRESVPEGIFQGVDWGEATVLGQTVERLPAGCKLALLPPWYDVDTLRDLAIMKCHVLAMRRAGVILELPHLIALLHW